MPNDYLLTDDFDLKIANGDFVVGESSAQHQQLLLLLEKGELRQYPQTGVGVKNFLNDDNLSGLHQEVVKQFKADGLTINRLKIYNDGQMELDANYQ
jgi:hypothetical protein